MNELMNTAKDGRTMDSREIAGLLNTTHTNIIRSIENELPKVGCHLKADTYKNEQNGQTYRCYKLPYRETMILVSGYSVELRTKVIDRWMELEQSNASKTLTGPALMAAALIEAAATMERQAKQIEQMKPAAQFYVDVTGSKDSIEMGQVAKIIDMGMGRNQLFEFLREKNILRQNNEPYQVYVDKGWFRVIEQKYQTTTGETRINIKTMVYNKGIEGIIALIRLQ